MKYKIIFKNYDKPDKIIECEIVEEIEETIKHFYIHESEVCLGEFLDFVEIHGISVNDIFKIRSNLMYDIEGDIIIVKEM